MTESNPVDCGDYQGKGDQNGNHAVIRRAWEWTLIFTTSLIWGFPNGKYLIIILLIIFAYLTIHIHGLTYNQI